MKTFLALNVFAKTAVVCLALVPIGILAGMAYAFWIHYRIEHEESNQKLEKLFDVFNDE